MSDLKKHDQPLHHATAADLPQTPEGSSSTAAADVKPTLEEVRDWTPEQLKAYLEPRIMPRKGDAWYSFVNLSPPVDGATFIDYGGDCVDYWIFERGVVAGVALCLVDELEHLGGWVKPPPSPRPRFPGSLLCHLPSAQKS
jgi:hypothetical protein